MEERGPALVPAEYLSSFGVGGRPWRREPVPPGGTDEGSGHRLQHPRGQARQVWKYIEKYKYTRNMLISIDENSRASEPDDVKL